MDFLIKAFGLSFAATLLMFAMVLLCFVSALAVGFAFYLSWNHGMVTFINWSLGPPRVTGVSYWTSVFIAWFISTVAMAVHGIRATATS